VNVWKWIAAVGAILSVTGIVALIWEQSVLDHSPFTGSAFNRWESAMSPLFVIGIGILIITAALILRAVETHQSN